MFNGNLLPFQEIHKNNLLLACNNSSSSNKLVLQAPTGSGKTVLVTSLISDYLDNHPYTVFIWLCPGAGSLQEQSRNVFEKFTTGITTGDIYSFISCDNPSGNVYFVNWDKIDKSTNVVLRDGEDKNLFDKIDECRLLKYFEFFLIIDEEHTNRKTAEYYESIFKPRNILRVSATTVTKTGHIEKIEDDEVIDAGLIASGISVNENLSKEAEDNNDMVDDLLLLNMADKKRKEIKEEYKKLKLNINPLVLIQFPNGRDEWITKVKSELANLGYTEKNGLVTSWFSGEHPDNPEEISNLDGKYAFLLFKQAIATGWDCPRAKILIKLREGTTEIFDIQTVGRIRRMAQRHHYDSEILNYCYIYTLDSKFREGMMSEISNSFYLGRHRCKTGMTVQLNREYLPESDRQAVDDIALAKALQQKILHDFHKEPGQKITKAELERKGYIMGCNLKTKAIEGFVRTAPDLQKLKASLCGEHSIDLHDDGILIRDAKRKIAQSVGIDENITSKALVKLFETTTTTEETDTQYRIIDNMRHREFFAFLVNNHELLEEIFSNLAKDGIELTDTKIEESIWSNPRFQLYKKHNHNESGNVLEKNAYQGYSTDILVPPNRSQAEIYFETWCERNDNIKFVYKNGDKGKDYFTIVYRVAVRRYNFYPDYILKMKNGETWIIEVKGGATADGTSQNIDNKAAYKFDALREYGNKYPDIKWGFVRNMGAKLYISNTEWDENLFNMDVWKPIDDILI